MDAGEACLMLDMGVDCAWHGQAALGAKTGECLASTMMADR